jgi:ADP-ribose pyrophosphatase YjhB (NUDIX family)
MTERQNTDGDIRAPHLRQNDFLGAFAVVETEAGILMVQNRRRIGGREVLTWDLPGGQVEPSETLVAALRRELQEEVDLSLRGDPSLLFVQEGLRTTGGRVDYAWRSFFFALARTEGIPTASSEVLALRWVQRHEMSSLLTAPYHDSFLRWLKTGGNFFTSTWAE